MPEHHFFDVVFFELLGKERALFFAVEGRVMDHRDEGIPFLHQFFRVRKRQFETFRFAKI